MNKLSRKIYKSRNNITSFILLLMIAVMANSCGIYSFSGTSIQPDVKSIYVADIQNRALRVNPMLSNMITEQLKEKYRRLTKLKFTDQDSDLIVEGEITSYEMVSLAVTAQEVAAQNRLSITVKIKFTNKKYPKEDFERPFAGFADYDSSNSFDSVESRLVETIVKQIVEDIFNNTVANW